MTTTEHNLIQLDTDSAYKKQYGLRRAARRPYKSVATTIPFDVVELAARRRGIGVDDFIDTHDAEFLYDGQDGVFLRFVQTKQTP